MDSRIIFHVDVNAAFLSWEASYRINVLGETLDLRNIPSAVGGDMEQRKGVILAKSTLAKKYGIQTGEPITSALLKCPDLVIVKPNFELYVKSSKAFIDILKEYTPVVEYYSIDEAYMDMTGTEGLYGPPVSVAKRIKDRIYEELGFTVNIGISSNKLLAKMAGELKKPNCVNTLFKEEIKEKLWPLKVNDLLFVGKSTAEKLKKLSIYTVGELAKADPNLLKAHLKKQGEIIYQYAHGIDNDKVRSEIQPNKGYSHSMTTPYDITSQEHAHMILLSLCETVCTRLRMDHMKASCLSVAIVDTYFDGSSHQKTLGTATNVTSEVYQCVCSIFKELWNPKTPIRKLGVYATKLTSQDSYQYNIFDMNKHDKYEKLDKAIDNIRNKYGEYSVIRASFLK